MKALDDLGEALATEIARSDLSSLIAYEM